MKYSALFIFALVSLSLAVTQDKFLGKQCSDPDSEMVTQYTGVVTGPTPCTAELCMDDKFQNCKPLSEGAYSMGDLGKNGIPNDSVQSVRVHGQPGCRLTVYQHADTSGW